MPTVISHSAVAVAASFGLGPTKRPWKFMILSIVCAVLPDADVIGYRWLYIPYHSFFGHRGFFHSPFFAALLGLLIVLVFYRRQRPLTKRWWLFFYFFMLTASHGVLDALTDGGRGIAFLSPFSNQRYFLPWTPIKVSPIGIRPFFSQRGLSVLMNELLWIWLPAFSAAMLIKSIMNKKVGRLFRDRAHESIPVAQQRGQGSRPPAGAGP